MNKGGFTAALLAIAAGAAPAVESGRTPAGVAYVSGGIGESERSALHEHRRDFSLWLITAAAKSGAYLTDVSVTIRDAAGREVFSGRLDGPWLFVDLPPGRYAVEAAAAGMVRKAATTIGRGDHRQVFVYFDTGADVQPDRPPGARPNPFDGDAPAAGRR